MPDAMFRKASRATNGNDGKNHTLDHLFRWLKQSWPRIQLLAPPLVGALLLSPFVLEHRLRTWISRDPFFAYIHFFLFFFPSPLAAGAFLEYSLITLFFVAVGLGLGFLAVCGCIWIDGANAPAYSSQKARAVGVCVLMLFCFTSGSLASYAPALKGPCRALVFSTVWQLTNQYDLISARILLDNFYPALVAMIVGIFCNLSIFPRTARRTSIGQLCDLLDGTQQLMVKAVEDLFADRTSLNGQDGHDQKPSTTIPTQNSSFKKLKDQLESLQNRLESNLDAAKYELSFTRVPLGNLPVLMPVLRDIRAWLSCTLSCLTDTKTRMADETFEPSHLPSITNVDSHTRPGLDFEHSIRTLSQEITRSLVCLRQSVTKCTGVDAPPKQPQPIDKQLEAMENSDDPLSLLSLHKQRLRDSIRTFKTALNDAIRGSRSEVIAKSTNASTAPADHLSSSALGVDVASSEPASSSPRPLPAVQTIALSQLFRNESYQISFLMISLLEVALLVDSCLNGALNMAKTWKDNPHRSLHMPAAKWSYWLSRTGIAFSEQTSLTDQPIDALLHEGEPPTPISELHREEVDYFDHRSEQALGSSMDTQSLQRTPSRASNSIKSAQSWLRARLRALHNAFRIHRALRFRFALSDAIRTLRHSRHIQFGIKLSAGIVLLTLPAWLAPGESKRWWLEKRGQWMAISYLFCLETFTGASIRTSLFRILGTISGSLLGLVISKVSRDNSYALAFLLTVATLPPSYFVLFTRFQGVGTVMGLTLPIVSLIPTQDEGQSTEYVAWNRGYMIFFGIIAALIVNLFFWPTHARLELVKRVSSITSQLQSLYLSLSRQMLSGGLTSSHKSNAAFEKLEASIGKRIGQARGLVDIMTIEISLKPKRTKLLSQLLDHLETILELLMGLRRCREHGLRSVRQHAVVNVLELRQSLIASVLLVLWTTGQALQTKAPLPQCLPSPRLALAELTEAVAEQLQMMVEGIGASPHLQTPHGHHGHNVPDAFHALDSLNQSNIFTNVRRRTRKRHGLHSIQTSSPIGLASRGGASTPARESSRGRAAALPALSGLDTPATQATTGGKKSLDYAMFFILAEHALLEEIVTSLEHLLELCRSMVGEASFLRTEFVPNLANALEELRTPGEATPAVHTAYTSEVEAHAATQVDKLAPIIPVESPLDTASESRNTRAISAMPRTHHSHLGPSPLAHESHDPPSD